MGSDITAVVNLHREGTNARPSIISAWRALEHARQHDLTCTLLLALDQPDRQTSVLAQEWTERQAIVVEFDEGDLGEARNRAVHAADSTWIAFLDGDDLWGEEWLTRAHAHATRSAPSDTITVWHPEMNVIFGDHQSIVHHVASTDPGFSWSRFRLHNQWTALSFVRHAALVELPYPRNDLTHGFGFEDWSWNEEVLRRGGRHLVVPDTCHFIHRSDGPSLLGESQEALRTRYRSEPGAKHVERTADDGHLVETDDATHEIAPVEMSDAITHQLRLASTIKPEIRGTIDPGSPPSALPQNFQTHVTSRHAALREIDEQALLAPAATTIADLLGTSPRLARLSSNDRAVVVAEVLLDPEQAHRARGSSPLIDDAIEVFPQIGE